GLGSLVEAHGWPEFEAGRQGDPKLKAARPSRLACTAAMPDAAASLHPLDATSGQHARCAVRVLITDAARGKIGEGRNARMRMQPEALESDSIVVEEIKEDERLQKLPEIRWAHQTGDGSVAVTPGAPGNLAYRAPGDGCRTGHWDLRDEAGDRWRQAATAAGRRSTMALRARSMPVAAPSGPTFKPSTWMNVTLSRPRKPNIARRYGSWKSMILAGPSL